MGASKDANTHCVHDRKGPVARGDGLTTTSEPAYRGCEVMRRYGFGDL
jgi:hypothetical protein